MSDELNPCVMTIVVTKATLARLRRAAEEMGRDDEALWQIASDMVDEAALQAFRNMDDDPGKGIQS